MSDAPPVMPDGISDFVPDGDFGALEMFDSNSMPPPMSSSAAPFASSAQGLDPDPDASSTKRHKRATHDSALSSTDARSKKKHKKAKKERRPDPDALPATQDPADLNGDALTASSKKKRKFSDAADGKRRKKRRSHGQHDAPDDHAAVDFLRKASDAAMATSSAVDDHVEASDPQKSPTVAHLRRRSQSHEVRSRENSVPPPGPDAMDLAPPAVQAEPEPEPETAAAAADVPVADVEALAREAWNEHRSGQGSFVATQETNGAAPGAAPGPGPGPGADAQQPPHPSDPSSTKRRSSRKKAKPTFFEQPPAEASDDEADAARQAFAEMPSPAAMTPKPRNRAKASAKREKKPKSDDGTPRARSSRLNNYTSGRFSDDELARISKAVEDFRADNGLTQEQVNQMIHVPGGTTAGEDHAQLWARIFAECPDRHRQKVINITRKKFHNFVARGTWTPEQDAELASLIGVHGQKWAKIAAIINRHPEDLRDRYRNYLVCGQNQRKDAWTEAEEAQLTQFVIHALDAIDELRASNPNSALLNASSEELIDWQAVSEQMGRTRSRLQCITKWKSLNIRTHAKDKLVSGEPDAQISFRLEKARRQIAAMPDEEKFRLVLAIQTTAVSKDAKIPWQRLVDKQFRNQWHRPTQMLLWRRLCETIPDGEVKTTRDCATELVERYNQTGELPEVDGDGYDDAQEMDYIQRIPVASFAANSTPGVRDHGNRSAEFVADSDVDDADADAADAEQGPDDDLKIDPALAETTPGPAKKTASARKTGTGKPPSRKKPNKAPTANMDPIEDDGPDQERRAGDGDGDDSDSSEVELPPSRQRKTPRRFKSPHARPAAQPVASPRSAGSESVMDDMDDLPARLPA